MNNFNTKDFLILIVDDIKDNLQIIGEILETNGYEITLAMSGQECLELLESVIPDLILLDLMMPKMDGLYLCKILKNHPNFKHIPIIFLTASHETEHLFQALNQGAVDYITKPFHAPELLSRVQTHLELSSLRSQLRIALEKQKLLVQIIEDLQEKLKLTSA